MKKLSLFLSWTMIFNLMPNSLLAEEDDYEPPVDAIEHCVPGVTCGLIIDEDVLKANMECIEENDEGVLPTDIEEIKKCFRTSDNRRIEFVNEALVEDPEKRFLTREKIRDKYDLKPLTEKLASDFKSCNFNSFNDEYRSASNLERRAEMVIRAFEYVYSGKGTIDYWLDENGNSLFEKASSFARNIRSYRKEIIEHNNKVNTIMRCKCMASFGINKFADQPDQMTFFNAKCAEHTKGMNLEVMAQGDIAETTGDASGIAQEKLILDYLQLRSQGQVNKFEGYTKIAENISEFVDYLKEIKWEQSWEYPTHLYDYDVVTLNSESRAASNIFGGTFSSIGWAEYDKRMEELEDDIKTNELMRPFAVSEGTVTSLGNYLTATQEDWTDWTTDRLRYADKDWKVAKRYYVGPYFDNTRSSLMKISPSVAIPESKKCEVFASSRACVKNIHLVVYEDENRYLLDAKLPEFVSESDFTQDSELIKKINSAYIVGTDKMISNIPAKKHNKQKLNYTDDLKDSYFKNIKHQGNIAQLFQPGSGNWTPPVFSAQAKIKAGAKKYALCKKLKECGAKYIEETDGDLYGFGYYITEDADASAFAKYVYEQHYLLPSLSAYSQMGYPTMAQVGYFEDIAYNLNVLALASADRTMNFGETYDHYKSDWDKRVTDYQLNNGMKDGLAQTSNAIYSKEFRNEFKRLNFESGANLGEIYDKNGKLKSPKNSGFNDSELSAIQTAARNALKNTKLIKSKIDPNASTAEKIFLQTKLDRQKEAKNSKSVSKLASRRGFKSSKTPELTTSNSQSTKMKKIYELEARKKRDNSISLKRRKKKRKSKGSSTSVSSQMSPQEFADGRALFESIDRHDKILQPTDTDSLFKVVSKAYKRNLYRIFKTKGPKLDSTHNDINLDKTRKLNDSKKDELRELLGE